MNSNHLVRSGRILERLSDKSKSQSWLAHRVGVSRGHICNILKARSRASDELIRRIAACLELPPDELLTESADPGARS